MDGPRAGVGADELRRFRRLADLTILVTFALIILGGIVRVSESGLGCGPGGSGAQGWPLCNGSAIPFFDNTEVIVEFSHRALAAIVTGLIVALSWVAYRHLRELRWPLRASLAAAALVLVQAGLGGLTVERSLAEELVAAHLGLAMLLLALLLWITVRARAEITASESAAGAGGPSGEGPAESQVRGLKPFATAAAVLLLCAIVAGGYVAGTEEEGVNSAQRNINGAHLACGKQFPGCLNQGAFPFGESRLSDIHLTHRAFVYGATFAILLLLGVAVARGSRSRLLGVAALLLVAQVLLGALNVWLGEHAALIVAHLATATLLWGAVILIASRLALSPVPAVAAPAEPERRTRTSTAAA
jgi:heme A synthase